MVLRRARSRLLRTTLGQKKLSRLEPPEPEMKISNSSNSSNSSTPIVLEKLDLNREEITALKEGLDALHPKLDGYTQQLRTVSDSLLSPEQITALKERLDAVYPTLEGYIQQMQVLSDELDRFGQKFDNLEAKLAQFQETMPSNSEAEAKTEPDSQQMQQEISQIKATLGWLRILGTMTIIVLVFIAVALASVIFGIEI